MGDGLMLAPPVSQSLKCPVYIWRYLESVVLLLTFEIFAKPWDSKNHISKTEFSAIPLLLSKNVCSFFLQVKCDFEMSEPDGSIDNTLLFLSVTPRLELIHLYFLSDHSTSSPQGEDIIKVNPMSILHSRKTRYSSTSEPDRCS